MNSPFIILVVKPIAMLTIHKSIRIQKNRNLVTTNTDALVSQRLAAKATGKLGRPGYYLRPLTVQEVTHRRLGSGISQPINLTVYQVAVSSSLHTGVSSVPGVKLASRQQITDELISPRSVPFRPVSI